MTASGDEQVRLTDEQRRPVETRLVSVALAAGAGCGKTTVLTERFLGEIDGANGRPLRALAAMTFTEKAARELRQRIRARCRAKLAAGVDPAWWSLVLRALEAAPIGTFHEFCGRLLRSRADELGLDPEFAILDEIIAASLRERATASAIRRLLADRDPDLLTLCVDYGLRSTREMLEKILAQRTPEEIEPFCEATAEELVDRWRDGWTDWGRPSALAKIGPSARRCQSVLEGLPANLSPKLALVRQDVLDGLAALASPTCSDDAVAQLREAAKIVGIRGKDAWPDADAKTLVGDAFKNLRAAIDGALKKMVWDEAATLEAAETTLRLARVAREVRRDYDALKRQRQGLDFADLIAQTRAALRQAAGARAAVDGAADLDASVIEFILVDEFQDTDEIQSDILRLLGGEGFASGRLFVVGDSKQSIYRFRGAEPAIFGRWRGEFPADGRPRLSENFRTVPRALHFVNALFAESFAEVGGAPGRAAADPEAIRLSAARPDHGDGPAVHFFWVEPPAPEPTDDAPAAKPPSARECRVREAEALARWLRGRLDAGWTIADRKTGAPRPAHAGDVAFLLRAMTDVWPYETALADQGFDYHTIGGSAFYSQQEVLDIINLLSVVEDPLDELALAGTLRGPFFSMTDEGLYWLSRAPGGLIAGLQRADDVHGLSDGDRARAVRARRLLARWRDLKDHAPMASLLARALDESGFSAALVCEFLGDRKLANVRKLVRTARDFDRRGGFGLADFVGRLRAFADDPPSEEQAAVTEEDGESVRIMTVHQAKGLEFPIVVLPDLNRSVGPRTSPLGFDRGLGLVVKPVGAGDGEVDGDGKSLGWLAHKAIEDREEREEALRLFYVATTRARDQLVLSAGFPKPLGALAVDKLSPALNLVWERFDGPSGRCVARLPDGWPAPEVAVVNTAAIDRAERRAARRARPDLQAIIGAIEAGARGVRSSSRAPSPAPLPRFIDLDAPLRDPSRAGRVGALIRACAVDPGLLGGEPPEAVAARVGARQIPAANAGRIAEAAAQLGAWVASPFFDRLPKTPAKRVRGPQSWTWRASPAAGPVVRGSCDALVQADDGAWRPLVFLTPNEPEAWGRARASLSLAALPVKLGPAWLIRIGLDGKIQTERRDRPTDDEVERMLRGCL